MFKITNGNEFNFVGRYNGQDYLFPKGECVACDDEAARHIFGIGDNDKSPYLVRHGWVQPTGALSTGLEILGKFKFDFVVPKSEIKNAIIEHEPAPMPQEASAFSDALNGAKEKAGAVASSKAERAPLDRLHRAVA